MIPAKQSAAVSPRSTGAVRASFGLNLLGLKDALIDTFAVLVRHRFCAPCGEMAATDRMDR